MSTTLCYVAALREVSCTEYRSAIIEEGYELQARTMMRRTGMKRFEDKMGSIGKG